MSHTTVAGPLPETEGSSDEEVPDAIEKRARSQWETHREKVLRENGFDDLIIE